ncbi:MAG: DUF4345 domain-containing protein [Pseudomonadota bacterium]
MTFAKIVLWLFGLITLAFGAYSLVAPEQLAQLTQYDLRSSGAITEIRAFYGGLELGLAAFWIAGALKPSLLRAALVSMILVWSAVAASRVFGLIIDDSLTSTMIIVLVSEVLGAALAFIALQRLPASP